VEKVNLAGVKHHTREGICRKGILWWTIERITQDANAQMIKVRAYLVTVACCDGTFKQAKWRRNFENFEVRVS